MTATVLTIGHSILEPQQVVALLHLHAVTAVVDVRSIPYSQRQPHFNREGLERGLLAHGIDYVFMGAELGGRYDEPALLGTDGRVDYLKVSSTPRFEAGVVRLVEIASRRRTALLCSEHDPLSCHRGLLISRALKSRGYRVEHVHRDGAVEPHEEAEVRLLALTGLEPLDLFRSEEEVLAEAYVRRAQEVAYQSPPQPRGH